MSEPQRASPDSATGDPDAALERAREELRALQRRFSGIVDRTADGILVVDDDGIIQFANTAAGELFGPSREDLVGSQFGHPVVAGERAEIDLVRSGQSLVAELRATESEWDGVNATIVSVRDVTDRKRAEEQARRLLAERVARTEAEEEAERAAFLSEASSRLFSSLDLHTTLQTVVSLTADGFADFCVVDTLVNDQVERFTATSASDSRARFMEDIEAYALEPDTETPQAQVFHDQEALLVTHVNDEWLRSATRDARHLELARGLGIRSLCIVPLTTGHGCVGVLTAVRWRAERFTERDCQLFCELGRRAALAIENAQLYQEAEAGNRAKANFLAIMSHELRTPLSAIIGYTDLLDSDVAGREPEMKKPFLDRIRSSADHLLQIIEEILAFSSTETGAAEVQVEEVALQELTDQVAALAAPLGRDSPVSLHVETERGETILRTDAHKLRQVLLNLVSNAFKFTTEGEVRIAARVSGDQAIFVVQDTGVGIPPERHETIFEPFWQIEDPMTRKAGGTGLGLAVARSFARLLGGDVAVDSSPGEGSVFTVRVPLRYDG